MGNRCSNKGQIQNQLFTYILTIVIIAMLMFFSVKWINGLMSTGEKMDVTRLKNDIETNFNRLTSNYGSYEYVEFTIPSSIRTVCFFDVKMQGGTNSKFDINAPICKESNELEYNPQMCDAWQAGTGNVLFDPFTDEIKVPNMEVHGGYKCFSSSQEKINVRIEGRGNSVKVS